MEMQVSKTGQVRKYLPDHFDISFSDKKHLYFRPVDHVGQFIGPGPEIQGNEDGPGFGRGKIGFDILGDN